MTPCFGQENSQLSPFEVCSSNLDKDVFPLAGLGLYHSHLRDEDNDGGTVIRPLVSYTEDSYDLTLVHYLRCVSTRFC